MNRLNKSSSTNNNQQVNQSNALNLAKQNLLSLGGTKLNQQALQGVNNPNTLWTKAVSILPTPESKKDATAAYRMTLVAQKLKELRNTIGEEQFGLLATSDQKFRQLYGGTRGQDVSRMVTQITNLLQNDRNNITGAAWGAKEDKEYLMKLPNQRDSVASYFGKLQGLLDSAYIDSQSTIGNAVGGQDVFDTLYGDMFKLDSTPQINGNLTDEQLLQMLTQ